MSTKTTKILKAVVPILLGIIILILINNSFSADQRKEVIKYIKQADYFWIGVSLLCGLLSHMSRAYRWKFMLEPLGYKPKFLNSFMAVMVAYFANLGIPRSGEVLRATTLSAYEGIPFEQGFGTIVAERIADLVMGIIIIGIALFVQYDILIDIVLKHIPENPMLLVILGIVGLIIVYIVFRLIKKSEHRLFVKIRVFLIGLKEGMISIFKMKHKWPFVFHTIFIWFMYIMMFYVVFFSLEELKNISLGAMLTSFVAGSFTIAATNGGIGFYQWAMRDTLHLFEYPKVVGYAFGWIMWTAQTIMTAVIGLFSFLFLPVFNRKK